MYSNTVLNLFSNPKNAGRIVKPEGIASLYNADETANVEFSLRVENNVITDCKFRAQANPYIVAVCSTITTMAKGKSIVDVFVDSTSVKTELDDFSDVDIEFCVECFNLAVEDCKGKLEKSGVEIKEEKEEKQEQPKEEPTKPTLTDLFNMLKPTAEAETKEDEKTTEEDDDFINLFDDEDF